MIDYVIRSDETYRGIILSGDGASEAKHGPAAAGSDPFDGFKVTFANGIRHDNGVGSFLVAYTVDSLQDQDMAVITGSDTLTVSFTTADFDYVYTCSNSDDLDSEEDVVVCTDPNNSYAPVWPNPDFFWTPSSGTIRVGSYFCKNLGSSNDPDDDDGTQPTVTVCDGPDWLKWNGSQIAGTPVEAGTFTWTLCASDNCYETSTTITFEVNP